MYYTIENRTDDEVGHVFPQVTCSSLDLAHSISFDKRSNLDREILFQLAPKAKLTDVLSQAAISAHGLLINKKVKYLLSGFKLVQHQFYKCEVRDLKGTSFEYYWLHLADYSLLNKINYRSSKFYTLEFGFRENDIMLNSYHDYLLKKEQLGKMQGIGADFVQLNKEFDSSLDLFNIPIFGKGIYAKTSLAEGFLNNRITGILLEPAKEISLPLIG